MNTDQATATQDVHDNAAPTKHPRLSKRVRMRRLETLNRRMLSALWACVAEAKEDMDCACRHKDCKNERREVPAKQLWKPVLSKPARRHKCE
jgi:hypothetical protein